MRVASATRRQAAATKMVSGFRWGSIRKSIAGQIPAISIRLSGPWRFPSSVSSVSTLCTGLKMPSGAMRTGSTRMPVNSAVGHTSRQQRGTTDRAERQHKQGQEDRRQPGGPAGAEDRDHAGQGDPQGYPQRAGPAAVHGDGDEHRWKAQKRRGDDLLDPAPQRVANEQRRRAREHRDRAGTVPGAQQPPGELEDQEGHRCGPERHRRLHRERDVLAGRKAHDRGGHEGADRVAAAEIGVDHRGVRRGRQLADPAAVLEGVVGQAHPGGGVVELDVARPARLAEDERGGE